MSSLVAVAFTSCSSDDDSLTSGQGATPAPTAKIYTMTVEAQKIGDGTRALSLDGTTLNSTWTAGDKVEVWTSDGTTKKYGELEAESTGASSKLSGTLTELPSNGESLLLKYQSDAYDSQKGTIKSISDNCDYSTATVTATVDGSSVTTTKAEFANQQAVIKFTLKNAAGSALPSNPTAFRMTDGTSMVTLTDIPAATYTTNGDGVLYVAFPGLNTSATITLSATVGDDVYSFEKTGITFTKGQYYGATVKMKPTAFSVSADKQVKFAPGNLRYVSGTWSFFDHQYDCYDDYSADAWDKFGWSTSSTTYGMSTSDEFSDYSGDFVDWGTVPGIGEGWYTLSSDEWTYLFETRSGAANKYGYATVNGVHGIIILPDVFVDPRKNKGSNAFVGSTTTGWDANEYTAENWALMEANGAVFLPAASSRDGDFVFSVGVEGYYWSSSAYDGDYAYSVYFGSGFLSVELGNRYYGYSVRLVRQVK